MTLTEYWDLLNKHDWYYHMSDSNKVYFAGEKAERELNSIAAESPEHKNLLEGFKAHFFSGKPWDTEKQPKPERP